MFQQQLDLTQQWGDQAQAGLAHQDIGFLLLWQGNYPEALSHFEKNYEIAKSLGLEKNVGFSLNDRANALWRLGRYPEARALLAEAAAIADRPDAAKNLSSSYHLAIARMALSEHLFSEAATQSQQALTLAGSQLKRTAAAATYTLGLAQALSGARREGRLKCEQAVEMSRQSGNPTLLSEALLTEAQVQILAGDTAGALKASLESQELSARTGSQESEWIAWLVAARASRSAGSHEAGEYVANSEKLLENLQKLWGSENYHAYLKRPDIQLFRTQLNQLVLEKH